MILIALLFGLVVLAAALWLRTDFPRSRWWQNANGLVDEKMAFATIPGLAGVLLGISILALGSMIPNPAGRWITGAAGALLLIAGIVVSMMAFGRKPLPSWLTPSWYHSDPKRRP